MSEPRGVSERLAWMLTNEPHEVGQCARWCWYALGGNQTPPSPPRWFTENANAVYDKVIASKRYWRGDDIPRGALVVWKYGKRGHVALSAGGGRIITTDPSGQPGGTGSEPLSYPERWGATPARRIWTDEYAGVRFAVGGPLSGDGYLSVKEETPRLVRSNVTHLVDIKGKTHWTPEMTGKATLATYINLNLPPSGSEARKAISRGGVRVWFQQYDRLESDHRNETGLLGPLSPPVFGDQYFLIPHVWPHTVDNDFWEVAFHIYAFDSKGVEVDVEVELRTREFKVWIPQ